MRTWSLGIGLSALLTLAIPTAAQNVWVVDDDGGVGVDFTNLQVAIDAAANGDVILVKDGTYQHFVIDGKSLDVMADEGDTVLVRDVSPNLSSRVTNIGVGQRVVFKDLDFPQQGTFQIATEGTLVIENNPGLVWLQNVSVNATVPEPIPLHEGQLAGLEIFDSATVVLHGVTSRGTDGNSFGSLGASSGLYVSNSNTYLYACDFRGALSNITGGLGVGGAVFVDSFASLQGGISIGGIGGPPFDPFTGAGAGTGGPGISVQGTSEVWSIGTTLGGGSGGIGVFTVGPTGDPSAVGPLASLDVVSVPSVAFQATSVVRDEDETDTTFVAGPGDIPFLLFNFVPGVTFFEAPPTAIAVGAAPLIFTLPPVPAEGEYMLTFGAPALPPSIDSFPYYLQTAYLTTGGQLVFSGPQIVHLIQDSF